MEKRDLIEGYATALLGVASAEGAIDRVSDELFHFAKAVEQNYDLKVALTDIHVPTERKRALLEDLVGDKASPHTVNILEFVVSQGRAGELVRIVEQLAELAAAEQDKVIAEVRSASPIEPAQRERLAEALGRATGKRVEVKVVVDPSVIGGIYARVGDHVIDGTVRRRLDELKERLEVGR